MHIGQMRVHAVGAAGRAGQQEMALAEPPDRAIIRDHAVLAQHEGVAATAQPEFGDRGGADDFEEAGGIRPGNVEFGQGGNIGEANGRAHGAGLAERGGVERFAGARIGARAVPITQWLPQRAKRHVFGMERQPPARCHVFAAAFTGKDAEGDRDIGWAECRQPDSGGGAGLVGAEPQQPGDVRGLALVRRHAEGGVAFEMFDRAKPFAPGKIEIGGGDVVLEIDKGLFGGRGGLRRGAVPAVRQVVGAGGVRRAATANPPAIGEDRIKPFDANRRTGAGLGLAAGGRNKGAAAIVPREIAAGLAVQVHRWGEAARHGNQVAGDAAGLAADHGGDRGDRGTMGVLNGVAGAGIDCGDNRGASPKQRCGGAMHIVGAAGDHDPPAGNHRKPLDIATHRARQHDAGAIIAAEQHRAFDAAGGENNPPGADAPQALRQRNRGTAGLDKAFDQGDQIMVVIARCGRAGEDAAPGGEDALVDGGDPCMACCCADG